MNKSELSKALFNECPVIYSDVLLGDLEYRCVSAVIYRVVNGKLTVSAELEDINRHSVIVAHPSRIRYKTQSEGEVKTK